MARPTAERHYQFADALALTGTTREQLTRWCDADIVTPAAGGGGKGFRRQFSFRNLIVIAVVARAHQLLVNEAGLRLLADAVVQASPATLDPTTPHVVWLGIESPINRDATAPVELKAVILPTVGTEDLLNMGYSGILIGLEDIVLALQAATAEEKLL